MKNVILIFIAIIILSTGVVLISQKLLIKNIDKKIDCSSGCPQYMPMKPGWCQDGKIISGGKDQCGCSLLPTCEKN